MKNVILTAIFTLSSSLFATNIKHTGLDFTRGMTVEINADGNVRNVGAGISVLQIDGTDLIDALCVNLFQGITVGQTYDAASIDASAYDMDGSSAAWLVQTFLPVVNAATGLARQIDGAALQLAIWDTIHDGGDGFADGHVRATGNTTASVLALANQWRLDAIDQNGAAKVFTAAPGTRTFQQQIYLSACASGNDCGGGEVPEPGTLVMMAVGAAAVLFGSWRR